MQRIIEEIFRDGADANAAFEGLTEAQWRELYTTSVEQGIAALVWDRVRETSAGGGANVTAMPHMPRDLKMRWAINVERIEAEYARQRAVIRKLAEFFALHGIGMMLLKGYGLSLNYPVPCHRPCGDIDIWLFEERTSPDGRRIKCNVRERADRLLHEHFGVDIDDGKHHHSILYIDGVMVENHYDFLNIHSHRSNRTVEDHLQRFVQGRMRAVDVDGATVYLPSADFHALFLLRHTAVHFAAERIGLRHLTDWRYFVEREGADVDWAALTSFARRMNMHRFLGCMNAVCIDCLDMPRGAVPAWERDPRLEQRVTAEILHPEFSAPKPVGAGYLRSWSYMLRRWWANRWKHAIVYSESSAQTFFVQLYSHLLKPSSLKI